MNHKLHFILNHSLIITYNNPQQSPTSFYSNQYLQPKHFKIKNFIFFYIKTENHYILTHYINLYKLISKPINIPSQFTPFKTKQQLENHITKTYI